MFDWNAVGAVGQIVAALGTLATLGFAVSLAAKADREARKAKTAGVQSARLLGAGMRLLAITLNKGGVDDGKARALQEYEALVSEIEQQYRDDMTA